MFFYKQTNKKTTRYKSNLTYWKGPVLLHHKAPDQSYQVEQADIGLQFFAIALTMFA